MDLNCHWDTTQGIEEVGPNNQDVANSEEGIEQGENSKRRTRGKQRRMRDWAEILFLKGFFSAMNLDGS